MKKILGLFGLIFTFCAAFLLFSEGEIKALDYKERVEFSITEIGYNRFYVLARCKFCGGGYDDYDQPCSYCSTGEVDGFNGVYFDAIYQITEHSILFDVYCYSIKAEARIEYTNEYNHTEYYYFYEDSYNAHYEFSGRGTYYFKVDVYGNSYPINTIVLV